MDTWIWLVIIIILSVLEVETVSLFSIWFIVSGIVSLILSILNVNFTICFGVFVILGLILLVTTRKSLLKVLKVKKENTNLDRIVGKKGVVTEDITKDNIGEVKVDGKRWSAYSDTDISKGECVKILSINSVKIKVKKWEEK